MTQEIPNLLRTYQRGLNEADVDLVRAVSASDWKFYRYIFNALTCRPPDTTPLPFVL